MGIQRCFEQPQAVKVLLIPWVLGILSIYCGVRLKFSCSAVQLCMQRLLGHILCDTKPKSCYRLSSDSIVRASPALQFDAEGWGKT